MWLWWPPAGGAPAPGAIIRVLECADKNNPIRVVWRYVTRYNHDCLRKTFGWATTTCFGAEIQRQRMLSIGVSEEGM